MKGFWRWLTCPHKNLRGVYGDEIIFGSGGRRIACTDCHRYLDLPLTAPRRRPQMNHAQEALGALSKSRDWLEDEEFAHADLAVKRAQVHATLALAEQQRIANLISYFTQIDDTSTALPVLNEIREALKLGDPK